MNKLEVKVLNCEAVADAEKIWFLPQGLLKEAIKFIRWQI